MSNVAIRAEGLGKLYHIGEREQYRLFRDLIANAVAAPSRWLRGLRSAGERDEANRILWALKDVSFELKCGEVLGIIGRNGAGKSTLLKILSRITEPTEGFADIFGRVGSLLEVGTGFHIDLTGRENIYMNGAILGMRRAETDSKFDEIVAFSELEKFVDTPVKHYSSGMYMRLAFAVAAHLDPEILVVDEVLAVGDAAFQKKCLGKMGEAAKHGRTVLFVSHNMGAVQSLCQQGLLLEKGRILDRGPVQSVVERYLASVSSMDIIPLDQREDRHGDGSIRLTSIRISPPEGGNVIRSSSRLKISVSYRSNSKIVNPRFLLVIQDVGGSPLFRLDNNWVGGLPDILPPEGIVTCVTDPINLTSGRCYVQLTVLRGGLLADHIEFAGHFDVEAENFCGAGRMPGRESSLIALPHLWSFS